MSMFQAYETACHIEKLRKFLGIPRAGFVEQYGLREQAEKEQGRLPRIAPETLAELHGLVNAQAAVADAEDSTFAQRLSLAMAYINMTPTTLGRNCGVSREAARRWCIDATPTVSIELIAEAVQAPAKWLEVGGAGNLPADSHLGLRVGDLALQLREELYAATLPLIVELPDDATDVQMMANIEEAVNARPELARLARQSGGRWQVVGGHLLFAPWQPLPEKPPTRSPWPLETEAIIEEELARCHSIYAAHKAIQARCEAARLPYPQRISLHKRIDRNRDRVVRFGLNLNDQVKAALDA